VVRSGALLPAPGILTAVHGDHQDFSALFSEGDGIGKPPQHEPADLAVNQGEGSWIAADALHRSSEGFSEVPSQYRLKPSVPALRFQQILYRLRQEAN
jgi:hypothetical protein